MKKTCLLAIVAAVFGPFIPAIPVFAQGTAFTYQGRLNNGGSPASGSYDFTSTLFNALSGPGQVGTVVTNMATAVSNGLFTVTLDFGANFPGADRWLEIGVRTNGVGGFATLSPRQKLTPTPYAMTAENLNGTVSSGGLSGTYGSAVTFNNAGNAFAGTFTGNGGGLTNVNAATLGGFGANAFWQLNGNSGTTPGVNFLATPDNQPLELHVNGQRASRLEPTIDNVNISNAVNVIQGSPANFVPAGVHGATIAGGGAAFYFGTGVANTVGDNYGTIGGGVNNNIMSNAWESTVAGGNVNWIYPGAYRSTIGGGWNNAIETNANTSFIGGGFGNVVDVGAIGATIGGGGTPGYINQVSSTLGTVAGGSGNVIQANANDSTVAGGRQNQINYGAWGGFIGGGHGNLIQTNDQYSTIGGGYQNTGNGNYSTVGGGFLNSSSGDMAAVGGGFGNTASGIGAFIGGGGVTKLSNGY